MTKPVGGKFNNGLTDAEAERLAILLEEMGEAQQVVGKILRHGYESRDPTLTNSPTNRSFLEKELGDVRTIVEMMIDARDISNLAIHSRSAEKYLKIKPYLHHQESVNAK